MNDVVITAACRTGIGKQKKPNPLAHRGLATLCAGGGMGTGVIVDREV